jgi:hypothetical protein
MEAVVELLSILGKDKLEDLEPEDINRRVSQGNVVNYAQLYPCIDEGCLLHMDSAPKNSWAGNSRQLALGGHFLEIPMTNNAASIETTGMATVNNRR